MDYKRLLIVSNAAVNDGDSNGRTIKSLIQGWDREKLAQFYTYGTPDFSTVQNCYRVTDGEALRSFLKRKAYGGKMVFSEQAVSVPVSEKKKTRKTPLTMLLRESVWRFGRWRSQAFRDWIDDFAPEAVFVFMGDSSFLLNIAMDIARDRNIPLYVYSCENYYFKDFNYITKHPSLFYAVFHRKYVKTVRRLAKEAERFVFISEALQNCYRKEFPDIRTDFIMTGSSLRGLTAQNGSMITYAGNLGIGRHKPLLAVANALQCIDPTLRLTLFGKLPNDQVAEEIKACPGIDYRGLVPYSQVVEVIEDSRLLLHVEHNDPFYLKDLQYAFSTKIADCVSSGVPFFCYAPAELPFTDFLKENDCAFVVHDSMALEDGLKTALFDVLARAQKQVNAKRTAEIYFDGTCNAEKFRQIICR